MSLVPFLWYAYHLQCFTSFMAQALFIVLCHIDMRRSHPLPVQLPQAYKSASHTFGAVTLNHMPSQVYIPNIPHPMDIEVWWLGMFQQSTHVPFCAPVT